jgi:hypothetical protein
MDHVFVLASRIASYGGGGLPLEQLHLEILQEILGKRWKERLGLEVALACCFELAASWTTAKLKCTAEAGCPGSQTAWPHLLTWTLSCWIDSCRSSIARCSAPRWRWAPAQL